MPQNKTLNVHPEDHQAGQFAVSRDWKVPLQTLEPLSKSLFRLWGNKTKDMVVLFVSDQGLIIISQRREGEVRLIILSSSRFIHYGNESK